MSDEDSSNAEDRQDLDIEDIDAESEATAGGVDEVQAKADADIIARAKRNLRIADEATSEIRKEALDDLKFRTGEQWPEEIKNSREQDKRPCLTINKLPQHSNQVINDIRQNRPAIQVDPLGNGAKEDTAEVIQGMVRHIETASDADIAYDTAVEMQVTIGFGYARIVTEYSNELSFDLEARIKMIENAFSVRLDPSGNMPDGSDTNWGHIFDDLSKDEFKTTYPNARLSQMNDWDTVGTTSEGWVTKDGCRITEYFEKEMKRTKLYLLNNGSTICEEDLPTPPETFPDGVELVRSGDGEPITRSTLRPKVMWYKLNGIEILERQEFPSKYIPIIPFYGPRFLVEGERKIESLIRHAKDPQRMYNFWKSAETEMIALAPKAPFIGAEGQFENHEEKWETANTRSHAFLEYNEVTIDGKPVGPPERQQFEPPVQAIRAAGLEAGEDIKSTTGIYDPSLGNKSNEQSGVAIQRRTAQAQTSNYHFSGNAKRSVRHIGRILVDMIPRVYDTARAVRIIDPEDEQQIVQINQIFMEGGEEKEHRLDLGTYDVAIDEGPSYHTKRQEFVASVLELVRANPQLWGQIGDLLVKEMDWPGARTVADRLVKFLPPALQDDKSPIPPQAQQQIAQMQSMIQELSGKLAAADEMIKTDMIKTSSKERVEMAKLRAEIEIELARLGHKSAEVVLDHQVDEIKQNTAAQNQMGSEPASGVNGAGAGPNQNVQTSTGGQPPGSNPME